MDADTWEMFTASGNVFDPTAAAGMRNIILAPGNTTDRAEAYRQFRGRDPDLNALLRTRGFPTAKQRAARRPAGATANGIAMRKDADAKPRLFLWLPADNGIGSVRRRKAARLFGEDWN